MTYGDEEILDAAIMSGEAATTHAEPMEMFVDYCPRAKKVVFVEDRRFDVVAYIAPEPPLSYVRMAAQKNITFQTAVIPLRSVSDGRRITACGWHADSKTVYLSDHGQALTPPPLRKDEE